MGGKRERMRLRALENTGYTGAAMRMAGILKRNMKHVNDEKKWCFAKGERYRGSGPCGDCNLCLRRMEHEARRIVKRIHEDAGDCSDGWLAPDDIANFLNDGDVRRYMGYIEDELTFAVCVGQLFVEMEPYDSEWD